MSLTNGPTLPPQAYTREMLSVAFQWLQNQPESIKRLAQTPDALVGLFMRAQRFGHSAPETDAPVTSQNFISDLKNLAEGLKQFEEPKASSLSEPKKEPTPEPKAIPAPAPQAPTKPELKKPPGAQASAPRISTNGANASMYQAAAASNHSSAPIQHVPQMNPYNQQVHSQPHGPSGFHIPAPAAAVAVSGMLAAQLNAQAQCMIQEVKSHLNLSSDAEVLNMMVALAYKNIKTLLG